MALPAILIPILAEIGAPILKRIIADKLPDGFGKDLTGTVIDTIAGRLGVEPTPEAIKDCYDRDPKECGRIIQNVEETYGEQFFLAAVQGRDALLKREDEKGAFWNAWRPSMSWLLIWLWFWNATLLPLLNAGFNSNLPPVPYETLVGFAGLWLAIYGGGHTIKSIFGKSANNDTP